MKLLLSLLGWPKRWGKGERANMADKLSDEELSEYRDIFNLVDRVSVIPRSFQAHPTSPSLTSAIK